MALHKVKYIQMVPVQAIPVRWMGAILMAGGHTKKFLVQKQVQQITVWN